MLMLHTFFMARKMNTKQLLKYTKKKKKFFQMGLKHLDMCITSIFTPQYCFHTPALWLSPTFLCSTTYTCSSIPLTLLQFGSPSTFPFFFLFHFEPKAPAVKRQSHVEHENSAIKLMWAGLKSEMCRDD